MCKLWAILFSPHLGRWRSGSSMAGLPGLGVGHTLGAWSAGAFARHDADSSESKSKCAAIAGVDAEGVSAPRRVLILTFGVK
jgi:hypothetical protein